MATIQDVWKRLPRGPKRWLRRQAWEQLSRIDTGSDLLFLNHGCELQAGAAHGLPLSERDEPNRYPIQLYHRVVAPAPLHDARVLEIGCGRGGGADYLARHHAPREMVGLDLTRTAVDFCRRTHRAPGLRFECGNAEALPFPDESFDAVVNVESSVLYDDVPGFLAETRRVLRPGGFLLFADYRKREKAPELLRQLRASGLALREQEDITRDVAASMGAEAVRKQALIERHAPRLLRPTFQRFAAVGEPGARERRQFQDGSRVYLRAALQKAPAPSGGA